ncbi:MAG: hypothetical protein H6Q67_160 [Firmicutes bacterium]|nr:hypothetical protein [Bacillota bacterium]
MSVVGDLMETSRRFWSSSILKQAAISPRLIGIGLLGVLLLVVGGFLEVKSPNKSEQPISQAETQVTAAPRTYEDILESKLCNLLSQVKGAGTVAVSITLENGTEQEYAQNVVKESKTVTEKDSGGGTRTTAETKESTQVLVVKDNGIDRPVVVREIKPSIKGVLVVAAGAQDSVVKANLVRAVQAALGIPLYKITVLPERK